MALIRGLMGAAPCPVCLVPNDKQSELGLEPLWPYRTVAESQQAVTSTKQMTQANREAILQPLGLRPVDVRDDTVYAKLLY